MADNKEITKVSLAILEYYDSKIKSWHNENSNNKRYVIFAARENFPTIGDGEILYVDNDKLYRWDELTSDYILINSTIEGQNPSIPIDHRLLSYRDSEEQHPIGAISGLEAELQRIPAPVEALKNSELEEILK